MRAVLFCLTTDDEVSFQPFVGAGALQHAHAFRSSVEPDFPDAIFSIWADIEAREDYQDTIFGPRDKEN